MALRQVREVSVYSRMSECDTGAAPPKASAIILANINMHPMKLLRQCIMM